MRKINTIIIHCSASDLVSQDSIEAIKALHVSPTSAFFKWGKYDTYGKGWSDVGYHYFINKKGEVREGRPERIMGAHASGHNHDSIAVCFSGDKDFTEDQFKAGRLLVARLMMKHSVSANNVFGHHAVNPSKTCPNFNVKEKLL